MDNSLAKNGLEIFLCLAMLTATSCRQNINMDLQKNPCESTDNINEKAKNIISKETAIIIAKGRTYTDYNFEYLDPIVIDKGENWMVTFDFKPQVISNRYIVGGAPTVVIEKSTGNIISVAGTK